MPLVAAVPLAPTDLAWRVIGLVNLYRLLVPPCVYALFVLAGTGSVIGSSHPELFLWTCLVYFTAGIAIIAGGRRLLPNQRATTYMHATVDTVAIALLMYSSAGAESGLGILLVVTVGAMALLADSRDAFTLATMATLVLLFQQIAVHVEVESTASEYTSSCIRGLIVFLVALLAWPVARLLCVSTAMVLRHPLDLANSAQLSQDIV